MLIAVFGSYAAFNGWQYWQRTQAVKASALYDVVDRAAAAGDTARVEQAYKDIRDKYGRTSYAQQAALLAAKTLEEKGNKDAAKAALQWVASDASDDDEHLHVRLHSVTLTEGATATGRALGSLGLHDIGAEVTILRRGKARIDVSPDVLLQTGDIVVLRGTNDAVARAEARLLKK